VIVIETGGVVKSMIFRENYRQQFTFSVQRSQTQKLIYKKNKIYKISIFSMAEKPIETKQKTKKKARN
jgi:hypothetical protein